MDYFERNHNFRPQVDAFANKKNKRFPKFYDDAWSEDWSEPLWIIPPLDVFPRVVQKLKQSGANAILMSPTGQDNLGSRTLWTFQSTLSSYLTRE